MKKGNLLVSSFLTVLLTGFVFTHSDWLPTKKTAHASSRHGDAAMAAASQDSMSSNAGRRWRTCQPSHWRGYMIQH